MLGVLFGFRGRIGRLAYFGASVAMFLVVLTIIVAAVMPFIAVLAPLADHPETPPDPAIIGRMLPSLLVIVLAALAYVWMGFSLQACRIRDIGWNPVFVIPGIIALMAITQAVAKAAPSLALIDPLVRLAVGGCLLFWPGQRYDPTFGGDFADDPATPAPAPVRRPQPVTAAPAAAPMFKAPSYEEPAQPQPRFVARQPAAPPAFGRRGLAPR